MSIEMKMATLEKAISIALEAHAGILDKSAAPYILHPLRIMLQMKTQEEMIVAVLHDVIEDSDYTLARLREIGFSETIVDALESVTRKQEESYEEYILRAGSNDLGRKIKYADLLDNLDISRIQKLTDRDLSRIQRYHHALEILTGVRSPAATKKQGPYTVFLGEI
jgi:(p)ppGpp synthase/HD superfamily hydrolase